MTDGPGNASRRSADLTGDGDGVVLVVEDFEDTRILYSQTLRDAGFEVATASDGEEAVTVAVALNPRLILMDMSLPRLDGYEATRRIRERLSDPSTVSIVALTAAATDGARARAFGAGCDGFIAKPCTPGVILSVVQAFVGRRTAG